MATQLTVHDLDVTDRLPNPTGDRLAGPLCGVKARTLPPAQADRGAQLREQEIALLVRLSGTLRVVGGGCPSELHLELLETLPVLPLSLGVEDRPSIRLEAEAGLGKSPPSGGGPGPRLDAGGEIDGRQLPARAGKQPSDVPQPLAVPQTHHSPGKAQRLVLQPIRTEALPRRGRVGQPSGWLRDGWRSRLDLRTLAQR